MRKVNQPVQPAVIQGRDYERPWDWLSVAAWMLTPLAGLAFWWFVPWLLIVGR